MTISDILKQALDLYKKNFVLLTGIVLPGWILIVFLGSLTGRVAFVSIPTANNTISKVELIQTGILSISAMALIFFLLFIVTAAGTITILKGMLKQEIKSGLAYKNVLDRIFLLLGSLVFSSIIISLAFVLPNFLFPGAGIIFGSLFYVQFNLVPQVVMLEGEDGIGATKRAKRLIRDYFKRSAILIASPLILQILLQILLMILIYRLFEPIHLSALTTMVVALLIIIAGTLTEPFKILISTLLYYDLRRTKEGYDLELMAKELAGEI